MIFFTESSTNFKMKKYNVTPHKHPITTFPDPHPFHTLFSCSGLSYLSLSPHYFTPFSHFMLLLRVVLFEPITTLFHTLFALYVIAQGCPIWACHHTISHPFCTLCYCSGLSYLSLSPHYFTPFSHFTLLLRVVPFRDR